MPSPTILICLCTRHGRFVTALQHCADSNTHCPCGAASCMLAIISLVCTAFALARSRRCGHFHWRLWYALLIAVPMFTRHEGYCSFSFETHCTITLRVFTELPLREITRAEVSLMTASSARSVLP